MLALFRTNQFIANALLIVYILLVRISVFFGGGIPVFSRPGQLTKWLYDIIPPESTGSFILASILVLFQAVLVNAIVSRHRIASEVTLFPGLFYILLSSCFSEFLYLSPLLIANTFYILVLMELFAVYRKYEAAGAIFNVGLWAGIASLFYFSYLFLLLMSMIALGMLRSFKLHEQIMLLFGFLTAYILSGTYYFVTDQLAAVWQYQLVDNWGFLDFNGTPDWVFYLKLGLMAVLLLIIIFSYGSYRRKKNMQKQKYVDVLFLSLFLSGFSLLFQNTIRLDHLLILIPPAAILLSFNFLNLKSSIAEALHILLLVGILVLQFKFWWLVG